MLDDRNIGKKKEGGWILFVNTGIMVFLVAVICFGFCLVGIKIGEGRAVDIEQAINEQNKELENLQDMILKVDTEVAGVKASVKNLKKYIEASVHNTPVNADGNTDEKKTENGTETNSGTASDASAENLPQQHRAE